MSQPFVRNMLGRQRKRALAIIMGHAERTFYDRLSADEKAAFRSVVLSAVSTYHDACLDMLESTVSDGMMVNDEAIRVIAEFNERVQTYRDHLADIHG